MCRPATTSASLFALKLPFRGSRTVTLPAINCILLFKIGAIGDVLLTTPLIRSLRARFSKAKIDYLVGHWSAPALVNNPHLSNVIEFDDEIIRRRNIPKLLALASDIRRRKYDAVIVLDPGWQAGMLASFFGSFCINVRRNYERIHDSQHYLALGQQFGCKTENTTLEFSRTADDKRVAENFVKNLPHPRVAICPGGAKNPYQDMPARRWPPQHYARLIRQLKAGGFGVIMLAGKKITLAQSAAVMAKCDVVVAHDQGLMHVAATTGTPIVALFGPTDPQLKNPLGRQHHIIWKAAYPCHYDGKLENCTLAHDMRAISVKEVFEAVTNVVLPVFSGTLVKPALSARARPKRGRKPRKTVFYFGRGQIVTEAAPG